MSSDLRTWIRLVKHVRLAEVLLVLARVIIILRVHVLLVSNFKWIVITELALDDHRLVDGSLVRASIGLVCFRLHELGAVAERGRVVTAVLNETKAVIDE